MRLPHRLRRIETPAGAVRAEIPKWGQAVKTSGAKIDRPAAGRAR